MSDPRRGLPAVHQVLAELPDVPHALAEVVVRDVLAEARQELAEGRRPSPVEAAWVIAEARRRLADAGPTLCRVVNATGVMVHTNLGRSPLSRPVAEAVLAAAGYVDLEYDLDRGRRGSRQRHVELLLRALTGAEAALVVNNNAAAVLLLLAALVAPGEVVVSRGELVEIGGSFRVPDVMALSGARLREVGTTNRTRLADYEAAVGPETRALMKVHRSNFVQKGFVEEAAVADLVRLARDRQLLVLYDAGSGAIEPVGDEPTLRAQVALGVDAVTASGDKLLGAGQAGVVVGRRDVVDRLRRHPLYRALRPDKLTLAALKATLHLWLTAPGEIRLVAMQRLTAADLAPRAERLAERLVAMGYPAEVRTHAAVVGGGALADTTWPGPAVAIPLDPGAAGRLQRALRRAPVPVITAVEEGVLWVDLRTVAEEEEEAVVAAFAAAKGEG